MSLVGRHLLADREPISQMLFYYIILCDSDNLFVSVGCLQSGLKNIAGLVMFAIYVTSIEVKRTVTSRKHVCYCFSAFHQARNASN